MPTTTDVRTLTTDLTTRSSDDNGMTVEGYAMLYDQPSVPMPFVEYIDRGALDNVDLSKVLLLYGHDLNSVLARSDAENLQLRADDKGLWFRATLPDRHWVVTRIPTWLMAISKAVRSALRSAMTNGYRETTAMLSIISGRSTS